MPAGTRGREEFAERGRVGGVSGPGSFGSRTGRGRWFETSRAHVRESPAKRRFASRERSQIRGSTGHHPTRSPDLVDQVVVGGGAKPGVGTVGVEIPSASSRKDPQAGLYGVSISSEERAGNRPASCARRARAAVPLAGEASEQRPGPVSESARVGRGHSSSLHRGTQGESGPPFACSPSTKTAPEGRVPT
jgi:hypothetical protein